MTDKVIDQIKGIFQQAAKTAQDIETQYKANPTGFDSKKAAADFEQARQQVMGVYDLLAKINPEEGTMQDDADFDPDATYDKSGDHPDSAYLIKKYLPRVQLLLQEAADLCKPDPDVKEFYNINVKLAILMNMMLDVEFGISLKHDPDAKKPEKPAKKTTK